MIRSRTFLLALAAAIAACTSTTDTVLVRPLDGVPAPDGYSSTFFYGPDDTEAPSCLRPEGELWIPGGPYASYDWRQCVVDDLGVRRTLAYNYGPSFWDDFGWHQCPDDEWEYADLPYCSP